jgi:hypothetical protein
VKKIGVYLGYPPGTVFSGEGLGRVLVALLQGASETGRVQFVIACPSWSRDPLSQLLREAGVATSAVAFLSPAGRPALFRLADWLQHRRLEKRKRLTGRKKRRPADSSQKPNISRAIIGTILSSRAGGSSRAVSRCLKDCGGGSQRPARHASRACSFLAAVPWNDFRHHPSSTMLKSAVSKD